MPVGGSERQRASWNKVALVVDSPPSLGALVPLPMLGAAKVRVLSRPEGAGSTSAAWLREASEF